MNVKEAVSDEQILSCWPVLKELIVHLKSPQDFLQKVKVQQSQGYRLFYIAGEDNNVYSILGFRPMDLLFTGKTLYIDDMCTVQSQRGKGYASHLMKWAVNWAKENGFERVTLDSTYPRTVAHKFYLNHGFTINALHFVQVFE